MSDRTTQRNVLVGAKKTQVSFFSKKDTHTMKRSLRSRFARNKVMTPRQIRFTKQQLQRLAAVSASTGLTISEIIRRAIDRYLKHNHE